MYCPDTPDVMLCAVCAGAPRDGGSGAGLFRAHQRQAREHGAGADERRGRVRAAGRRAMDSRQ